MKSLLDHYCRLLKAAITLLLALMIVPVSMQILSRYTGIIPRYIWTEEIARFCFVWIVMVGAIIAVREETHFEVDLMPAPKTPREHGLSKLIVHVSMLLMAMVFVWYGIQFARFGHAQQSEMTGINLLWIYVAFPLAGLSWVIFLTEKLAGDICMIRDNRMIRDRDSRPADEEGG